MDKDIPLPDGGVALEIVGLLGKSDAFGEVCRSVLLEGGRSNKVCLSDGRR